MRKSEWLHVETPTKVWIVDVCCEPMKVVEDVLKSKWKGWADTEKNGLMVPCDVFIWRPDAEKSLKKIETWVKRQEALYGKERWAWRKMGWEEDTQGGKR